MRKPEEEQLLNDILGGEGTEPGRDATLVRSLDALRTRARRQRALQADPALTTLILFLGLRWHFQQRVSAPSDVAFGPAAAPRESKVKYLTEKEVVCFVFRIVPSRWTGRPGHQQFILLNQLRTKP